MVNNNNTMSPIWRRSAGVNMYSINIYIHLLRFVEHLALFLNFIMDITMCPKSSNPFYIVSYYIKWVTTAWSHSNITFIAIYLSFIKYLKEAAKKVS